jgi:predicted RND superfamily exporter protein
MSCFRLKVARFSFERVLLSKRVFFSAIVDDSSKLEFAMSGEKNIQYATQYRFLKWPVTRTKRVLFITLLLLVVATIGAKNLYFKGDYQIFFDGTNKQLQAFEEIQNTFNKSDNISIVIAPDDGNIFRKKMLTLIEEMTQEAWKTPFSSRVDSLSNFQHTQATGDDLSVADLFDRKTQFTRKKIEAIKNIALSEPTIKNLVISAKGDVSVINVTLQLPDKDKTAEVLKVVHYVGNMIERYKQKYPHVHFYQAGITTMDYAYILSAQQDSETIIPLMLLGILVFLTLMLRSFLSVVATLCVIALSVMSTLGVYGWIGMYLSTSTVNIPTLIMTLAVADCVHLIALMRKNMSEGQSKAEAIIHSLSINFVPVIITSLTTAVGFAMLNMSDSPALRNFGNLAAFGVVVSCVLALTLLPALLMVLPIRVKSPVGRQKATMMDGIAEFVIARRNLLLLLSVIAVAVSAVYVTKNKVNDNSIEYFSPHSAFRQAADFMQRHISGMTGISVEIKSNRSQGISDPQFIRVLSDFTDWLRTQPEVDHVTSLSDVYKRLNKNMHGDNPAYYQLPANRELASQYLLLYEMSLPYGLDLSNQIDIDKSAVRVMLTIDNLGSKKLVVLENRIDQWFRLHGPQYPILVSSPSLMFAHIGEKNMTSMLESLPISLAMISALMVFALRSLKLGLISLVPNMVPAIIGFGLWGVISGEINLGLSVVVSLTLGIVVDDAVHFLSKYKYARQTGKTSEDAVRYAFHTVGQALWITSVVLGVGFFILGLSDFRLNSDMGELSAIIIVVALVVDFLFLPTLLMFFDRKRQTTQEIDITT